MKPLHRVLSLATVAAAAILAVPAASAALTFSSAVNANAGGTVTGDPVSARTSFESSFVSGTIKRESFSGLAPEVVSAPLTGLFPSTTGNGTLSLTSGVGYVDSDATNPDSGRFDTTCPTPIPTDPDGCVRQWFETNGTFAINFGGPFSGFGFYVTDLGDFGATLTLSMTRTDSSVELRTFSFGATGDGALAFIGAFDDTDRYTGASITINQPPVENGQALIDYFGFDDLVIGLAPDDGGNVPEPTTLALTGLGLLGLAVARRRLG